MIKPIIVFILFFFLFINKSAGQGLLFDSAEFNKQPLFSYDRGILPEKSSLEKFIPTLFAQKNSTCVAMSFAMARTIIYAYTLRLTDASVIFKNSFSPYFIYYHARSKDDFDCNLGLSPTNAINVLKEYGCEKLTNLEFPNYFPFTNKILCNSTNDLILKSMDLHLQNAIKFKISAFYVTKTIEGIKYALSKKNPVVIAMQIPKSFDKPNSLLWQPLAGEVRQKTYGHTVVAIGYDDNTFGGSIRIVNSWGDKWGDNGKIWIKYTDLENWFDGAYIIINSPLEFKSN